MAVATKRATKKKTPPKRYAEAVRKTKPDGIPTDEISTVDSYLFANRISRYNPDDLVGSKGLTIYRKMLQDEQIKAAIFAKQFAVLSTGWEIEAPDFPEGEVEMAEELQHFIEFNFAEMQGGTLDSQLLEIMSALAYGFSVTERVYYLIDFGEFNGRVGLKALKTRKPENFEFITDQFGNLEPDGIVQNGKRLPQDRFTIWCYRKMFNNFYGNSDLREAYRAYWLKEQILRFMVITLERYGEPITVFKHKGRISTPTRLNLESFIKGLQSKSGMILPEEIQHFFESPKVNTNEAYIPALNLLDTHLRISILMPGLLGMSAEKQVGSLARSSTEFDVFLWVVNQLRQEIAETVMNDQIIKPLIDLNYDVIGGKYPRFKFKELTEEHRFKVFELFSGAAKNKVLKVTRDDQNHLRDLVEFPPLPEDEDGLFPEPKMVMPPGFRPMDPDDDEEDEEEEEFGGPDDENVVAITSKRYIRRTRTEFEKRVDFQAIADVFDKTAQKLDNEVRKVLREVRTETLARVENMINGGLRALAITQFSIDVGIEVADLFNLALGDTWRRGRDMSIKELPPRVRRELSDSLKEFAGFPPNEAMDFFDAQSLEIKGIIDADLTNRAKAELFQQLQGGRALTETMNELRRIFEPWIGDPTKIAPSGPGRPRPENVLMAHRLENMVRTPITGAFAQGRLTVGKEAGDFVIGYQYSAILDTRTTDVDRRADGLKIRKDDPRLVRLTPPLHFNCRGTLIFITEEDQPVRFSSGASVDGAVRLVMPGFGGNRPPSGGTRRRRRAPAKAPTVGAVVGVGVGAVGALPLDQQIARLTASADGIVESEGMTAQLEKIRADLLAGTTTRNLHRIRNNNTEYTLGRELLHNSILSKLFKDAKEAKAPAFVLSGGLPGSGKSSIIKRKSFVNFVKIDSDEIKKQLPEYKGWNAGLLQTEADDIIDRAIILARDRRLNVLFDVTLKNANKYREVLGEMKQRGYKTGMIFAKLSPEKTMGRALERFRDDGRFVDPRYIAQHDHLNEQAFDDLKKLVDFYEKFDTDVARNAPPILLESVGRLEALSLGALPFAPGVEARFPRLARFGAKLRVDDFEDDPFVENFVIKLDAMNDKQLNALVAGGTEIRFGTMTYPRLTNRPELATQQPRGWPAGTTFNDVAGAYNPGDNMLTITSAGQKMSQLGRVVPHEVGHALSRVMAKTKGKKNEVQNHSEVRRAHIANFGKLPKYFKQGGPGGEAGMSEFFAESVAQFVDPPLSTINQLIISGRQAVIEFADEQYANWLETILTEQGG